MHTYNVIKAGVVLTENCDYAHNYSDHNQSKDVKYCSFNHNLQAYSLCFNCMSFILKFACSSASENRFKDAGNPVNNGWFPERSRNVSLWFSECSQ